MPGNILTQQKILVPAMIGGGGWVETGDGTGAGSQQDIFQWLTTDSSAPQFLPNSPASIFFEIYLRLTLNSAIEDGITFTVYLTPTGDSPTSGTIIYQTGANAVGGEDPTDLRLQIKSKGAGNFICVGTMQSQTAFDWGSSAYYYGVAVDNSVPLSIHVVANFTSNDPGNSGDIEIGYVKQFPLVIR